MTPTPNSYDIQKKQCPEGFHSHPNNTRCHPINQPHRPGSKAEKEHFEMGLDNSWYEQHGTTKEEYDKEHGGDSGEEKPKGPEEEPEQTPEKEPEKPSAPQNPVSGFKSDSKIEDKLKPVYDRKDKIIKAREKFYDHYDDSKSQVDNWTGFLKECGFDTTLSPNSKKLLKSLSHETVRDIIGSYAEVAQVMPVGMFAIQDIRMSTRETNAPLMNCDPLTGDFTLFVKVMGDTQSIYSQVKVLDPITEKRETWSFHFNGATSSNCIAHEYGHNISSLLCMMNILKEEGETDFSDPLAVRKKFTPVTYDRTALHGKYSSWKESEEMKSHIRKLFAEQERRNRERYRDCRQAYSELFGIELSKIQPSDVYSGYGYYMNSWTREVYYRDKDEEGYSKVLDSPVNGTTNAIDEVLAEAYCDVTIRKDKANSMSVLHVAHTQYELAQITYGYEGTFMDYIKEYVGLDRFKERIVKNEGYWRNYLVYAPNGIAKGFKLGTPRSVIQEYIIEERKKND